MTSLKLFNIIILIKYGIENRGILKINNKEISCFYKTEIHRVINHLDWKVTR